MKNRHVFILLTGGLLLSPLIAQPPGDKPRRGERGGMGPPPLERYMQKMEQEHPEEYQRLQKLKAEDPQAFRMELRNKAAQFRNGNSRPIARGPHPLQNEIARVKAAQTPEERESAIAALQLKIAEQVDENLAERQVAIEKFREKLKQLEDQNEQEQTRRAEIVDHHLQRILENLENYDPPPEKE